MKKLLALILALTMVFALCACGQQSAPAEAPAAEAPAAADAEADAPVEEAPLSGTVVIYSTQTDVDHEVFLSIFNELYPDVDVEFISGSLGELTARVDAEKENPQADIIFGGLSQTDGDQYIDLLQEYTPKYAADCAVESNGYYTYFTYQYLSVHLPHQEP